MPTISASTMSPASRRKPLPPSATSTNASTTSGNAAVRSSQFRENIATRHPGEARLRRNARRARDACRALTLTIRRHEMNLRANAVVFVFGEERRVRGGRGRLRGVVRRGNFADSSVSSPVRYHRRAAFARDRDALFRGLLGPSGTRRRGRFRRSRPRDCSPRVPRACRVRFRPHSVGPVVPPLRPRGPARAPERSRRGVRGAGGDARQHRSNRRSGTHAPRANHTRHAAFHECEDDRLERWTEAVRALHGRARRRVRRRSRAARAPPLSLWTFWRMRRRGSSRLARASIRRRRRKRRRGPPAVSPTTISPAVSLSLALKLLRGDGERA